MTPLSTPALDAWRRRERPGPYDALASAAAWEMAAIEAHRAGQRERTRDCLDRAAEIINGDGAAILEIGAEPPAPSAADHAERLERLRREYA